MLSYRIAILVGNAGQVLGPATEKDIGALAAWPIGGCSEMLCAPAFQGCDTPRCIKRYYMQVRVVLGRLPFPDSRIPQIKVEIYSLDHKYRA